MIVSVWRNDMRKLLASALIGLTLFSSSVYAGEWQRHHHAPRHHNHHYNGGNNNWVAPLVGGLIIGGLIMNSQQGYYQQSYRYQPVCQNVFMGSYWNGWRWVNQYQVICD